MSWGNANTIHRTAKQLIDSERASDPEEAMSILRSQVLQILVGRTEELDRAHLAVALPTIVNTAHRAFLGGVRVRVNHDVTLAAGWGVGLSASEAVMRFGGEVVDRLDPSHPTLVLGSTEDRPPGSIVLHITTEGWCGGVVEDPANCLRGGGNALASIAASALGVSETFQHALESAVAGRRDVGISLWRPDVYWRDADAFGPRLAYLPSGMWLLGLGHLGQAYAWTIGSLPYSSPGDVRLFLVDFDTIVEGNLATGALLRNGDQGLAKARVVARRLEEIGFTTSIIERAFSDDLRPTEFEPRVAFAGFDRPEPRRALGAERFSRVVDAGLGAGPVEYLDIVVHTFPSQLEPHAAFAGTGRPSRPLIAPYEDAVSRLLSQGVTEGDARCGMLEIAGVTVGAAFVGAFASSVVVADAVRSLHGGSEYAVLSVDLRSPEVVQAVVNADPADEVNTGMVRV